MATLLDLPDELLSMILVLADIEEILVNLQRVNQRFRLLIQREPCLLKKLTYKASDSTPPIPCDDLRARSDKTKHETQQLREWCYDLYHINPLIYRLDLLSLITAYVDEYDHSYKKSEGLTLYQRGWSRNLVAKTCWLADPSRRDIWLRENASWRRFLVRPLKDDNILRLDLTSEAFDLVEDDVDNWRRRGYIEFQDGLTLGDLYDLVTTPELGLFRSNLKHDLGWKLKLGVTWIPGKNEGYIETANRACLYVYHILEGGRKEGQPIPVEPEDFGNFLHDRGEENHTDVFQVHDPSDDGHVSTVVTEVRRRLRSTRVLPRVSDYASCASHIASLLSSARLKITLEDEYFTAATFDPDKNSIYCNWPSPYGPETIGPFVLMYSEHTRHEYWTCREMIVSVLKELRARGKLYVHEYVDGKRVPFAT